MFFQSSISSDPVSTSPLISTIKGTTLVAVLSVFSLSNGNLFGSLISIILVASLFIVYSIFSSGFKVKILPLSSVDIETNIKAIAGRTIITLLAALAFQSFILGPPNSNITLVLFTGLVKAFSWFFTIQTARQTSWCIATTIGTFALACTRNPFSQTSQLQALSHVAVSTLTLHQTTQLLPKQSKGKILLWSCLSASIIPYLYNEYMIHDATSSASATFVTSPSHPIKLLTQEAAPIFGRKILDQSRTYPAALKQYKQRYGLDPPPGFEAWFQYALKHNSPIVDEFDMIHSAISPFLKLSGKEVSEMIEKVYKTPQSEVWLCEFSGKTAKTKCRHPSRSYDRHYSYIFDKLLWNLPGVLPDVKFLINHFDEPRVVIPPQGGVDKAIRLNDVSMKPTWDALTKSCPSHKTYRDDQSRVETFGLPFVKDHLSESDLCKHPEYKDMHGTFISPKTFRLIEGLAPVLSRV
ncbi:hypothetical protein H9Q70_014415 [Fusarium xylarioides]|nr:hypothetical protein H9Q70_014415 [Fusarium xylarioides]